MKYQKTELGVVVQIQPNYGNGFIECDDSVVCGMLFDGVSYTNPPLIFDEVKERKLQEAIAACDEELRVITSLYADAERETWVIQELEASNFQHDVNNLVTPKRATPNIDWIIAARDGVPADDVSRQALTTRILEKAYIFHNLSSVAVGKRHKMNDAIEAALTIEALEAITWG